MTSFDPACSRCAWDEVDPALDNDPSACASESVSRGSWTTACPAFLATTVAAAAADENGRTNAFGSLGPTTGPTVPRDAQAAARAAVLTPSEAASPLASRPYDLRHAAVSTWLNAGVRPTQVAEWAGHSIAVLLRVYAKCIAGQEEAARLRIRHALGLLE
jgi:hypothetical protein